MKVVSTTEKAAFVTFVLVTMAYLYWITTKTPNWKQDRMITTMIFVTALTALSTVLQNDILGNIAHTLYAAILVYALTDSDNKDVVLLTVFLTLMTTVVNIVFKRCTWAAIFNYSTDYKDKSNLIARDTAVLSGALFVKYLMLN